MMYSYTVQVANPKQSEVKKIKQLRSKSNRLKDNVVKFIEGEGVIGHYQWSFIIVSLVKMEGLRSKK